MQKQILAELARRELARRHLLDFIQYHDRSFQAGWFHRALCEILENTVAPLLSRNASVSPYGNRLILTMPPRHGKTTIASHNLPAWALGCNPDLRVIATSYSAELASSNNRSVQRVIDSDRYHLLFPHTTLSSDNVRAIAKGSALRNSDIFEIVGHKGSYRSAGRGGAITGFGGQLLIIDDPLKNREEAESPTIREKLWDWYRSTLRTRLEDNGVIIIILTRWHTQDLAGKLLELSQQESDSDQWQLISFKAISEEGDDNPLDPRKPGEALWSLKYPIAELNKIRASIGSYDFTTLYQQSPFLQGGGVLQLAWFPRYSYLPLDIVRVVQSWDTAQERSETSANWACVTLAEDSKGRIFIAEVFVRNMDYVQGRKVIAAHYRNICEAVHPPVAVLIEKKSTGASLLQENSAGELGIRLPAIGITPHGNKLERAQAEAPICESGGVFLPEQAPWLSKFIDALVTFPSGAKDEIDALSQGLRWMRLNPVNRQSSGIVGEARGIRQLVAGL